jgi:proteasome activator subunit 4
MNTPQMRAGNLKDFLSIPLSRTGVTPERTYLAGCKALDSLVKLIASVESFLHPSNSGGWTADVSSQHKHVFPRS